MNPDLLLTASLRAARWGAAVTRILAAALDAVDPAAAVHRYLRRDGDLLRAGDRRYDLRDFERVFVVGTGKAGAPMARAAAEVLGDRLAGGVMVVKGYGDGQKLQIAECKLQIEEPNLQSTIYNLQFVEAGHPIPDERGVAGARQIAQLLEQATERDLVIALISGGGSALLTLPPEGITLAELQKLTNILLRCGANINEINTLRKHLDQVKGGGLARLAHPASMITLVLSDVVGSPLDVIASGPTVPDTSSFAEAYAVLERYGVVAEAPTPIVDRLRRGMAGQIAETLKPGDPRLARVHNLIVGSNPQAAAAALAAARKHGFNTLLLTTFLQAEAREAGRMLAAVARELASTGQPLPRPACIIAGGETTVTLRGSGRGGRNQELALAAVPELAGLPDMALIALATDGGDGPTDAAGAVATGATLERARAQGLDPAAYLARNDAYPFFEALGDLLRPGPTETNVNDLVFVFAFKGIA
ncbi:MAG TPA: glycerate kinase [Roseiflexaceae bacterium]|nr:glycerate kinase [Roseiflexaceae bacterium]